jgi:putative endonuclease
MFYVYMLASKPYGTLYVGMTSDLLKRVWEHKSKVVPGFTRRYGVDRLVWFEAYEAQEAALRRE